MLKYSKGSTVPIPRSVKWTEESITEELKILCDQIGGFPTSTVLQELGRLDLIHAIQKNGNFFHYREVLGYEVRFKPKDYWVDHYENEVEKIVKELGRFPTPTEFRKSNNSLFKFLVEKDLFPHLQKQYNYTPPTKPRGYWNDFNNLKDWLMDHFEDIIKLGEFPTCSMITEIPKSAVIKDVIRRHGGFNSVAEKLNCKVKNTFVSEDGHYLDSSYELILDSYLYSRNIPHQVHGIIDKKFGYRFDFKVGDIYVEIWGLSGNDYRGYDEKRKIKENLYSELDYELISIEPQLFEKPYKEIENTFDSIFIKYGFDVSKKQVTYEISDSLKGKNYWTFENTLKELKIVVAEINRFPSVSYLRGIGKYQIQKSMQKFGGQNTFRRILGFPLLVGKVVPKTQRP